MTPFLDMTPPPPLWPARPELLLHPNIPPGAAKLNPRTILGKEWWDATRKSAEASNNSHCFACLIHRDNTQEGWLEGHETYDIDYEKKHMIYKGTVSLCTPCHKFIHCGFLLMQLATYEIDEAVYVNTILHGIRVLSNANLKPKPEHLLTMLQGLQHLHGIPLRMMEDLLEKYREDVTKVVEHPPVYPNERADNWSLIMGPDEYKKAGVDLEGLIPL